MALRLKAAPTLVAVVVAWIGMLVSFLLVVPIYQAPDEPAHVDRVRDAAVGGFPDYANDVLGPEIIASREILSWSFSPTPLLPESAPERPQPNFADLSTTENVEAPNQLAGHPPAYYALMGGLRSSATMMFPRGLWQFDAEILLLRFFNVLIIAPLPLILARTAKELGMSSPLQLLAAVTPLCIPQLAHIGASVNNDNLLVLASSVCLMFAARVLARGLEWRPVIGLAIFAAVAMQTKLFGLLIAAFGAGVLLVALSRSPSAWPRVLAAGGVMLTASWTYLRNIVIHGHIYPTRPPEGAPPLIADFEINPLSFIEALFLSTTSSFWGRFGWLTVPLPLVWGLALTTALLMCVTLAVVLPSGPWVRTMLMPIWLVAPMYVATAWIGHLQSGYFPAQQGRYLFPVLGSLAVAVASALSRLRPSIATSAMGITALVGWSLSMIVAIPAFWSGHHFAYLVSIAEWSPLGYASPVLLVLAGVFVVGGLLFVTVGVHGSQSRALELVKDPGGGLPGQIG